MIPIFTASLLIISMVDECLGTDAKRPNTLPERTWCLYARHTILVDRENIVVAPIINTRGFTICQKLGQCVGTCRAGLGATQLLLRRRRLFLLFTHRTWLSCCIYFLSPAKAKEVSKKRFCLLVGAVACLVLLTHLHLFYEMRIVIHSWPLR